MFLRQFNLSCYGGATDEIYVWRAGLESRLIDCALEKTSMADGVER
jgi:hypothetical protein